MVELLFLFITNIKLLSYSPNKNYCCGYFYYVLITIVPKLNQELDNDKWTITPSFLHIAYILRDYYSKRGEKQNQELIPEKRSKQNVP